jgi:peptidoglycan/xylan/chitin deacetylase (PgdA/CDA1 family)
MERIKDLAKSFLYYSRYYHLIRFWRELVHPEGKLIILAYHNLSDENEGLDGSFSPLNLRSETTSQEFELQLRILRKWYRVVSLEEGVNWLKKGKGSRDKLVVITFDDSYESFYTLAFPLLKKYDFTATVFLPTDFVNTRKIFWWDELQQIIFHAFPSGKSASFLVQVIGENLTEQFSRTGKDIQCKRLFLESLELYLRELDDGQREEKVENLKKILLEGQKLELRTVKKLTWEQIVEMSREGISFGSHSCSHLNFKYASLERAKEELSKSKQKIEENTKKRVVSFAYPFAADFETHLRIRPIISRLQYECACACWSGVNLFDADAFFLRRMTLPMTTLSPLIKREFMLI